MDEWLSSGRRIKSEWLAMLQGMRERTPEKVKLPFVPLSMSGKSLRMVMADMLPLVLGPNPSLLTVVRKGGACIKAYAEDASGGVYEKLAQLDVADSPGIDALRDRAKQEGIDVGVVKDADSAFFELFAAEPDDLLQALAELAARGAEALRHDLLSFQPPLPAAQIAKGFGLEAEQTRDLLGRLLPDGRYGVALICSEGPVALSVEVGDGRWAVDEVELAEDGRGADGSVLGVCRELVERHRCGLAFGAKLADVRAAIGGEMPLERFVAARASSWDLVTRSGLEGLLRLLMPAVRTLGLEEDMRECSMDLASVLKLIARYVESAVGYARHNGIRFRLTDGADVFPFVLDSSGIRADEDQQPDDTLGLDLGVVRGAIAVLMADPLARVRDLVPREVMDEASYSTAVVLLECGQSGGRLILFGGPHEFFNRSWEGDSCAVFVDGRGRTEVFEQPSRALAIEDGGRRISFRSDGATADLAFVRASVRRNRHGVGRFFGDDRLGDWLPGLDVERSLFRFESGDASLGDKRLKISGGWMFLESGRGRLLHWPFGATWHYASWLDPAGACGSMVHSAPMLGNSTPTWWRRFIEDATDGAYPLWAEAGADTASPAYEIALEPGPPVRLVLDRATAGEVELRYSIVSAAVVPFDEDGQVIFRLRCLCGQGAGLVEIPVFLPGVELGASQCDYDFREQGAFFRAGGREVLRVETRDSSFITAYSPPSAGVLRRLAGWFTGRP